MKVSWKQTNRKQKSSYYAYNLEEILETLAFRWNYFILKIIIKVYYFGLLHNLVCIHPNYSFKIFSMMHRFSGLQFQENQNVRLNMMKM